jgi:hypothetical protein
MLESNFSSCEDPDANTWDNGKTSDVLGRNPKDFCV